MTSKIINFPIEKTLRSNLPVEACLNQAKSLGLSSVVVIGYTEEGNFFFSASKEMTNESTLYLLKCSEKYLFEE